MKRKHLWKQIATHLSPYKLYVFAVILSSALSSILSLAIPFTVGQSIDTMLGENGVNFSALTLCVVQIGIMTAAVAIFQWLGHIFSHKVAYSVGKDMRKAAFDRLQITPLSYIDSHPLGDVVSRIMTDTDRFSDGLILGFSQLFSGVITIIGTLTFMLLIEPLITVIVVLLTPLSILVARFVAKHTYDMFKAQSKAQGEQTAYIDEMIEGRKVIKAYAREAECNAEFEVINQHFSKCSLKAIFFSSLTNPSTRFINNIVYAAVALFGSFFGMVSKITIGGLTSFLSYATQYAKPFNEISGVFTEFQNALACAERVFDIANTEIEPPEEPDAMDLLDANGDVALCDVSFAYDPSRPLMQHLSLTVDSGSQVAIVGPTGCGKTTLINLLMRFYDVNEGCITLDGFDIRSLTRSSLRSSYGMVLQDTWLKTGTIKENIMIGKEDATDDEVILAAKAAHAHSFIKRLPQGYDTIIGEGGTSLSLGQKQLLSIARVMIKLPPMLILDEATSSIDTRTEMKIQAAFREMMKGRTSFVVAHRLSTIRTADMILVMRDGNIVEMGDHETLLSQNGFYAELYNSQFIPT